CVPNKLSGFQRGKRPAASSLLANSFQGIKVSITSLRRGFLAGGPCQPGGLSAIRASRDTMSVGAKASRPMRAFQSTTQEIRAGSRTSRPTSRTLGLSVRRAVRSLVATAVCTLGQPPDGTGNIGQQVVALLDAEVGGGLS